MNAKVNKCLTRGKVLDKKHFTAFTERLSLASNKKLNTAADCRKIAAIDALDAHRLKQKKKVIN